MRKDYFLTGLGMRLIMLAIFIYSNNYDQYNDMSEIIFYSFQQLLQGKNPYSIIYELEWGSSSFFQPMNYGPVTFILFAPALLLPQWYNSLWVGMYFMINIYNFLLCEYLIKKSSIDQDLQKYAQEKTIGGDPRANRVMYYSGIFLWILPFGTTVVTNFVWAPAFLATLAFGEREKPMLSGFIMSMAAMCYQLVYLFIPVYVIFYYKRSWVDVKNYVIGCIPAVLLLGFFEFWGAGGAIQSLFLYTSDMPYEKCPQCEHDFDQYMLFSIPRVVYDLTNGEVKLGNYCRLIMFAVLIFYLAKYFFTKAYDEDPIRFILKYTIIATLSFTLSNNYGQAHYMFFMIIPMFMYLQLTHPDYRKQVPIGQHVQTAQDFENYMKYYHRIPQ